MFTNALHFLNIWPKMLRTLRDKSSPVAWDLVRKAHHLVFLIYLAVVSAILLTAGVFAVVIHSVSQYQNKGYLYFDAIYLVGLIDIVVCIGASLWLLSIQRWVHVFNLDKYLNPEPK